MSTTNHSTGTVASGDVTLFYRRFGKPGGPPVLILHGAQYFDSADWIGVADGIASDREVVAFDARGFGESTWSPSKNYSTDAGIADILTVLDELGWARAVIMGHSRGGGFALLFAAHFPERTAGLILVDRSPDGPVAGRGQRSEGRPSVNNKPKVYPTIEAAQADMGRDTNTPPGSSARARLESILKPVEGGFILGRRDPDFNNTIPLGSPGWAPKHLMGDMWLELAKVQAPAAIIRGTRSDRFNPEALLRIRSEFTHIDYIEIDADHDMACAAQEPLIDVVNRFLRKRVGPRSGANA